MMKNGTGRKKGKFEINKAGFAATLVAEISKCDFVIDGWTDRRTDRNVASRIACP